MAQDRPVGVAMATGFLEVFLDEDVPLPEGRALLRRLDQWAHDSSFSRGGAQPRPALRRSR
jgi:hypothetical protein